MLVLVAACFFVCVCVCVCVCVMFRPHSLSFTHTRTHIHSLPSRFSGQDILLPSRILFHSQGTTYSPTLCTSYRTLRSPQPFSLSLQGDTYVRYQSFADENELEKALCKMVPVKIDIGAIYSAKVCDYSCLCTDGAAVLSASTSRSCSICSAQRQERN